MNRNPSMAGLASLVQSRGRNGDSVLVHMAPEEVRGLQSLALAHGGSLTLNPETGLYEASFLKKLLPTIIGLALAPLTAGTSLAFLGNPLVAGALVGGVEGLRTGDLGKGLMAGLGAFGGASLGAGLSAAAGTAGATGAGAAGAKTAEQIAQKAITDAGTFGYSNAVPAAQTAINTAATSASAAPTGFFNQMGQGISALAKPAGREAFLKAVPGGMMGVTAGGMGIADALTPEYKFPDPSTSIDDSYYESYGYSPEQGRFLGGQWRKGYPGFPGYAMGGAVMPRTNYDYPQAGITKSNYAPSLEYTKPQEILDGYDTKIDPFTGAERFAEGGEVEERDPIRPAQAAITPRPTDYDRDLAKYNQDLHMETMRILTMNPGMSYNAAKEAVGGMSQYNPQLAGGAPDPSRYGVTGASAGYGNVFDKSANFDWGADLAYDPSLYQRQFTWQDYIAKNPDLAAAGIDTPWEAAQHYAHYGKNENRQGANFLMPETPVLSPEEQFREQMNERISALQERQAQQPVAPTPTPAAPTTTPAPTGIASTLPRTPFVQNVSTTTTAPTSYIPAAQAPSSYYQSPSSYFTAAQPPTPDQFPSLEEYYKTLMTAPQQQTPSSSFADYMQSLNKFVTSPVAPPVIPQTAVAPPPNTTVTGGGTGTTGTGTGTSLPGGFGGMQWDPAQGRFVNTPGSMGDTYNNFSELQNLVNSGTFPGFNFGDLGNYLGTGGYGDTSGMVWNPSTGSFMQPDTQLDVNAAPYNMQTQTAANTYTQPTFGLPAVTPTIPYNNPYQNSMSTGDYATAVTSPYITEPEIDYGSDVFGLGQDANIFGFASGGEVQKAAAGKLVTGEGDGMSDDIRANIDGHQEARLADGEFVIPADVVSHLGNGSTEAGADQLHAMMDRIRKARTGRQQQAPEIDPDKYLPA